MPRSSPARARWPVRALPLALLLGLGGGSARAAEWTVDPGQSVLSVHVFRAGAFSSQLHDHRFVPARWSATLRFDPAQPTAAALRVSVDAGSLRDEEPGLSASDREKVEQELRSPKVLDVERFPEVRFELQRLLVQTQAPGAQRLRGALTGWLELHGRRGPLTLPVQVSWDADHLEASGTVTFKQSAFGIKPYKKLLGTIAVHDEVQVEIHLVASAAPGS